MFLHSGASLHGHEYSKRPSSTSPAPGNRRAPLLRSAFATPIALSNTVTDNAKIHTPQWRRRLSESGPYTPAEPIVRFQEPEVIPPPKHEPMSEDDTSYSASELSCLSDGATDPKPRRRRRAPRRSTLYMFSHPPPRQRLRRQLPIHIRPKLLLQLREHSNGKPVIDVFPSSLMAGNVVAPRFSRRFPRLFGVKGELGHNDTILVKSEDYNAHSPDSDSEAEESSLDKRDLVAVFSPLSNGEDGEHVVLADGAVWVAKQMPTGSYEFVHTDVHGNKTTARWIRKSVSEIATPSSIGTSNNYLSRPDTKFTFSVVDPRWRRHPILGTLTRDSLEILHSYTTVSQSSARYPPSRSMGRSPNPFSSSTSASPSAATTPVTETTPVEGDLSILSNPTPFKERTTYPVDDDLRKLMTILAIWVYRKQGWSESHGPAISPSDQASPPAMGDSIAAALHPTRLGPLRHCSPQSEGSQTPELRVGRRRTADFLDAAGGRPGTLRRGQTHPVQQQANSRDPSPATSVNAFAAAAPRRATSTGAAFMHRRMQSQVSDASDSERVGLGRLKPGRRRRVVSGDFGQGFHFQPPATADVASLAQDKPPPLASEQPIIPERPVSGPTHRLIGGDRHRRTQSAYYPEAPMGRIESDVVEDPRMDNVGGGRELHYDDGRDQVDRLDGGARWRRFSNWVRHLGRR